MISDLISVLFLPVMILIVLGCAYELRRQARLIGQEVNRQFRNMDDLGD